MTYYEDLTFFQYTQSDWVFENGFPYFLLNIGWLDNSHPYSQENYDNIEKEVLLLCIFNYCMYRVNLTSGHHTCNLCQKEYGRILNVHRKGKDITLGNGEIFVKGRNNIVYVAPTLIYHYIETHNYKPPREFVDAVTADTTKENFSFFKDMETQVQYNRETAQKQKENIDLNPLRFLLGD